MLNRAHTQTDFGYPYRVDFVDPFATLVTFAAHPVAVEVGTDTIEHFA